MECRYIWKKPWFYRREERLKNFFLFVLTFWGPFFSVSSTTTTSRVTSKKSIRTSFKAKMNYYSHNDSVFRGTHTIWWSYSAHSDLKSEKKLLNFPLFYSDEWGNSAQNDNLCVFWIILLWISIFAREKKERAGISKKKKKSVIIYLISFKNLETACLENNVGWNTYVLSKSLIDISSKRRPRKTIGKCFEAGCAQFS